MPPVIKNSKDLIDPNKLHLKMLVIAQPGFGKTEFESTVPDIGLGVCEEGHGHGLATVAHKSLPYVELSNYSDFDAFCSGSVFGDKGAVGLDSLSTMVRTFIKDYALTLPRAKGQSQKRSMGIPELDDYGTMGEITRRLLAKLLHQDKHVIVTATMRIDKPDPDTGQGEMLIGPDLPGQLFLGSTAMFDIVLFGRTRRLLKNPSDAKSAYNQRYWVTQGGGGIIAKCRYRGLKNEEIYDKDSGEGCFPDLLKKIQAAYAA